MINLSDLDAVIANRFTQPAETSYVASLKQQGLNKMLEKVGEESTEFILAAKDAHLEKSSQKLEELVGEAADLWFHSLIALAECGLSSKEVMTILEQRFGTSGLTEKANRLNNKD